MKRPALILMLCLLAGLLAWWELREVQPPAADKPGPEQAAAPAPKPAPAPVSTPAATPPSAEPPIPATLPAAAAPAAPAPVAAVADAKEGKTGPRFKRAYMLSIEKGAVSFLEAQDIEGDFAQPRRKPDEWSGMLRCRLMSETNTVLAEELLPAPDYVCNVLDPQVSETKPVRYTAEGPVVFQVRMPRVQGAVRLDVFRIIQPGEQPLEGQLASIPLPRS